MPLEHGSVRISLLDAVNVRASGVVHIAYNHRSFGSTVVDVQRFIKSPTVRGQLECAAHFPAQRTLFIRYELASIPVCRHFLMVFVRLLLQLASVGVQGHLPELIVRHIDLRILEVDTERLRRVNQRLHFRIACNVLSTTSWRPVGSSVPWVGITTSHRATARVAARVASGIASWITARIPAAWIVIVGIGARVTSALSFRGSNLLLGIIAVVVIEPPSSGEGCPWLNVRALRSRCCRLGRRRLLL